MSWPALDLSSANALPGRALTARRGVLGLEEVAVDDPGRERPQDGDQHEQHDRVGARAGVRLGDPQPDSVEEQDRRELGPVQSAQEQQEVGGALCPVQMAIDRPHGHCGDDRLRGPACHVEHRVLGEAQRDRGENPRRRAAEPFAEPEDADQGEEARGAADDQPQARPGSAEQPEDRREDHREWLERWAAVVAESDLRADDVTGELLTPADPGVRIGARDPRQHEHADDPEDQADDEDGRQRPIAEDPDGPGGGTFGRSSRVRCGPLGNGLRTDHASGHSSNHRGGP